MCLHKYINTTCCICFWCLCISNFRTDHFVLDNQAADSQEEAPSPSQQTTVAGSPGLGECETPGFPFLISMSIDVGIVQSPGVLALMIFPALFFIVILVNSWTIP